MRAAVASILALAWLAGVPAAAPDLAWPAMVVLPLACGVVIGLIARHAWTVPAYAMAVGVGGAVLELQLDAALNNPPLVGLGYLYVLPFAALCVAAGALGLVLRLFVGVVVETISARKA